MRDRGEGGFTLVEILIVLAVLGILAAVVVPNLTGFLGRSKDQAYLADQGVLQAAVNSYYTDMLAGRGSKYPTGNGTGGAAGSNTYVNMTWLVSGNYLTGVPQSAGAENPGGSSGSYSWYVSSTGVVTSTPVYASGVYP